jgi:NAD(P)-dependent dehydrogenase (short-subunit alcohol dehydrogenase family)
MVDAVNHERSKSMTSFNHPPPLSLVSSRLADKVTFVTGASSGIGRAAAIRFAAEGAKVVAASRRQEQLDDVVDAIRDRGHDAIAMVCDVTDEESVHHAIDATLEHFGRLDCAFNNAGGPGGHRPLHELDTGWFDLVIATNLRGPFLCMKYEIPAMLSSGGGSIVNTSSIGGLVGGARNSDYGASKWGLAGLVKCAAMDYARQGIRVNAIAPGPTRSEMFDAWMPDDDARAAMAEHFPQNYIADPDDMARAALFLLSDESRWTTGCVLPCEGGASVD